MPPNCKLDHGVADMSDHHRLCRRSSDSSSSRWNSRYRSSRPTSTNDHDEKGGPGHHRRRFKRSSCSSSVGRRSPDYRPGWAILSIAGARRKDFPSDRTTSATALSSNGGEVSVSFDLVGPPGISVLAVDPRRGPGPVASTRPDVVATHRDVVLLDISAMLSPFSRADALVDYFVYHANGDPSRRLPSLSLLPVHYHEEKSFTGKPSQVLLHKDDTGIMSCRSKEGDNSSFVVAKLTKTRADVDSLPEIEVVTFLSGSGTWEVFKKVHVHGSNGGHGLRWWSTDAVVADYQRRFLIWVDYYRGMILMDMSSWESSPRLRYVPLPVETAPGDPYDYIYHGRGCPGHSRSVCATRHGIKFVSIDSKHCSNWGVGHDKVLMWNHTFRITTWSLREGDYTWRKDARMYEEELWAVLGSGDRFPRVPPEKPVVNMENPDAVCFRLKKNAYRYEDPTWMIEVDMRKKVLVTATAHTKTTSSSYEEDAINSVRIGSHDLFFSTELPHYLDDGQACKKRRR
ncbi:unnamed protein product [Urochloa decumbens]|uniref:DUF1618 domain-containing protein n=1 Tax=Urochloa decumbens TaxID=240449 RepID=A0ABC9B7Q1_9POAL